MHVLWVLGLDCYKIYLFCDKLIVDFFNLNCKVEKVPMSTKMNKSNLVDSAKSAYKPGDLSGRHLHVCRLTSVLFVNVKSLFLGTSEGGIMVFDIPPRGTAVKLQETLNSHKVAICELEAQGGRMLSSDEEGNITLWQSGGHFTEVIKIDGKG